MPVSFSNFVLYHFFLFQVLFFRHFFISMKVVDHHSHVAPKETSVHRNRHVYPRPAKNFIKSFLEILMYFLRSSGSTYKVDFREPDVRLANRTKFCLVIERLNLNFTNIRFFDRPDRHSCLKSGQLCPVIFLPKLT